MLQRIFSRQLGACLLALGWFVLSAEASDPKAYPRTGSKLELRVRTIDGRIADLSEWRGKVVLLDFWASWCGPCQKNIPLLKSLYQQHQSEGFEILGISQDTSREALVQYLQAQSIPWHQYLDGSDMGLSLSGAFHVDSVPTLWLIDREGVLKDKQAEKKLQRKVERLLKRKVATPE